MYTHYYAARPRFLAQRAAASRPAAWQPRVDIREQADRYVILADLPGVDPQTIAVEMDGNVLSIKGERTIADGEGEYSRVERRRGAFQRSFALPDNADATSIVANGQYGVLEVSIPKKPELAPRRIQVGVRALESAGSSAEGAAGQQDNPGAGIQ